MSEQDIANGAAILALPELRAAVEALLSLPSVRPYIRTEPYVSLRTALVKAEGLL